MLGDIPLITLDYGGTGLLVGVHHGLKVFGVEVFGESGGAYEITEHHRELPPLTLGDCRTRSRRLWRLGLVPRGSPSRGPPLLLARRRRRGERAAALPAELGR